MYNSIVFRKVLTHLPAGDGKLKVLLRKTTFLMYNVQELVG